MNTPHTPGPWVYQAHFNQFNRDSEGNAHYLCAVSGNLDPKGYGDTICNVTTFYDGGRVMPKDEWLANARLIAESPELLRLLEEGQELADSAAGNWDNGPDCLKALQTLTQWAMEARAAVAKAKGEA